MSEKVRGIYCYRDLKNNGEIVYIGKDSNIHYNKRHKAHLQPSRYNNQPFNRVLQNNPDRYEYEVLRTGEFNENWLNALEILYIRRYQPKFNFTIGGEGTTGYKKSEETKKKLSESLKGHKVSEETKKKISEGNKNKIVSDESKRKMSEAKKGKRPPELAFKKAIEATKGKPLSKEHKNNIRESLLKNHARIIKRGKTYNGKQYYVIKMNGKEIKGSIYPSKLLKWFTETYPTEILQIKIGDNNNSVIGEKPCN